MDNQASIEIVWDRENNEASYHLAGLTHMEAQRVLMAILQDNFENALAEVSQENNLERIKTNGNGI